jgi:ribosomal protein S18 acetylase RimI-like enzyme
MTTAVLPDEFSVRAPTKADAEVILELVAARNIAAVGFADYTLDDMVDELTEPGFYPETDGWLVLSGDTVVGYGTVFGRGDHQLLDIDVVTGDRVVGEWLLGQIERRAAEIGHSHGHAEVFLDSGTYRSDETKRALLADHGFAPGTAYHRMRIDHPGPVEPPEVPTDVVLRRGAPDEATRRAAYELHMTTFEGQFGYVWRPYDEWHAAREAWSAFDWSQLTVAEVDGRPVAFVENTSEFIEDTNCNYIGRLGVLEEARGRGLAKFLLRDAFATDATAGRAGTILHVDTNNPTPALGLYLSVGMQPILAIDAWRRTLATA